MSNNVQIQNAALAAFLGASQLNRGIPTPLPAAEITAAQAFSVELDSLIPTDGTIVTPVTAVTLEKVNILTALVAGAVGDRANLGASGASYLALCTSIAAAYAQAVALLV